MESTLMSLPSELLTTVLAYLPVVSLLNFSATCRTNQVQGHRALNALNLAVLPNNIHCSMALMSKRFQPHTQYSATADDDTTDLLYSSISKTTQISTRKPTELTAAARVDQQIEAQNDIAADVLSRVSLANLRSLSLHMYDLRSSRLASVMATRLTKLQHLELKFAHPYIYDQCVAPNYWYEAPSGSPAWNALVGLGQESQQKLRMHGLLSLRIERAGLTSTQLRRFIESNPLLRRIHFDSVTGVDQDFVQWLATYCESGRSRLEKITFESCSQLQMQRLEDFAWLAGITESEVSYLSLYRCRNVRQDILVRLIEEADDDDEEGLDLDLLETLIPPMGPPRHFGIAEVVPSRPQSVVLQASLGMTTGMDKIEVDPEHVASSEVYI